MDLHSLDDDLLLSSSLSASLNLTDSPDLFPSSPSKRLPTSFLGATSPVTPKGYHSGRRESLVLFSEIERASADSIDSLTPDFLEDSDNIPSPVHSSPPELPTVISRLDRLPDKLKNILAQVSSSTPHGQAGIKSDTEEENERRSAVLGESYEKTPVKKQVAALDMDTFLKDSPMPLKILVKDNIKLDSAKEATIADADAEISPSKDDERTFLNEAGNEETNASTPKARALKISPDPEEDVSQSPPVSYKPNIVFASDLFGKKRNKPSNLAQTYTFLAADTTPKSKLLIPVSQDDTESVDDGQKGETEFIAGDIDAVCEAGMEKKEIHHPAETSDVYTMEPAEMPLTSKSPSKQKEPVLETPTSTSFQFTAISTPQSSSKSVSDLIQKYRQIREPGNSPLIKFSSPEIASAHQDNTPKVGEMVYSVKRLKLNEIPNNNLKATVESNVEHLNVKERNGTLSDNFREKPEVNPTFKPRVVVKSAISVPTSASGKIKAKSPKSVSRMHSSSSLTLSRSSPRSVLSGTKKHTEVRTALEDDETHVNTPTRTVKRKASMSSPHYPLVSSSSLPVSKLKIKVPTAKRSISGLNFTPSTSLPNPRHITSGPSSIPSSQLKQPSQIHQPSLLRKPSVKKLSTAAPSSTELNSQVESDQKVTVKTGIKIPAVAISSKLPVSRLKMPSVVSKGKT